MAVSFLQLELTLSLVNDGWKVIQYQCRKKLVRSVVNYGSNNSGTYRKQILSGQLS